MMTTMKYRHYFIQILHFVLQLYHDISADSDVTKQTLKLLKNTMFHKFHINL